MSELATLDPRLRPFAERFVAQVRQAGVQVQITSVYRSLAKQRKLYREYLAGRHPLPVAPPGTSLHERGLAFDLVVSPPELQASVGAFWERWGGKWGGRYGDPVHFDVKGVPGFA